MNSVVQSSVSKCLQLGICLDKPMAISLKKLYTVISTNESVDHPDTFLCSSTMFDQHNGWHHIPSTYLGRKRKYRGKRLFEQSIRVSISVIRYFSRMDTRRWSMVVKGTVATFINVLKAHAHLPLNLEEPMQPIHLPLNPKEPMQPIHLPPKEPIQLIPLTLEEPMQPIQLPPKGPIQLIPLTPEESTSSAPLNGESSIGDEYLQMKRKIEHLELENMKLKKAMKILIGV